MKPREFEMNIGNHNFYKKLLIFVSENAPWAEGISVKIWKSDKTDEEKHNEYRKLLESIFDLQLVIKSVADVFSFDISDIQTRMDIISNKEIYESDPTIPGHARALEKKERYDNEKPY